MRAVLSICIVLCAFSAVAQKDGPGIVPERFLRGYDPITVFFNKETGPAEGGPLDKPAGVMDLQPAHPGEYIWRDARTLQFLPTIPWPALKSYEVRAGGKTAELYTFMSKPTRTSPYAGMRNLKPFSELAMDFPQPVDPRDLAAMITLTVKPLPGTAGQQGYRLTANDFTIKTVERSGLSAPARYVLSLHEPVGYGHAVSVHLRLSLKSDGEEALTTLKYYTKSVFRLKEAGTTTMRYPVSLRGSIYSREQAIRGGDGPTRLQFIFSDNLGPVALEQVKRMVHFEPAVEDLDFSVSGRNLNLKFKADRDRAYRLRLMHTPMVDKDGRQLALFGETRMWFYFDHARPYLRWSQREGILERYGARQLKMEARGDSRVDLRIYKIEPDDRRFWPFNYSVHNLNEDARPPSPGEEPNAFQPNSDHIKLLGSPPVSRIVNLPTPNGGAASAFGLDLAPMLTEIDGPDRPGTYLIGFRPLGGNDRREYARVQVTDLSLSTIEEVDGVTFAVTGLKTGEPISGARLLVEGLDRNLDVVSMIDGVTGIDGLFRYRHTAALPHAVFRIRVIKGEDQLVLDPAKAPPHFLNNHFYSAYNPWLGWLNQRPNTYRSAVNAMVHLSVERPVYRPEEPVHIKGWLRHRKEGKLTMPNNSDSRAVVVSGPGDKTWTYPVSLTRYGSFYVKFDEKDLPTGDFTVQLDEPEFGRRGYATFKKEAYRIPRFELSLSGPDAAPLDRPFKLTLTADYYAGGRVVGRPVSWKITSFPYRFRPEAWPGFLFSTNERFSDGPRRRATAGENREDVTDDNGSAEISIDPTTNRDSKPMRYVVEATVLGADEQTVSTVKAIKALPPFILGIKLDRFLEDETTIRPKLIVLDYDSKPLVGKEVTVRLLNRQWHSYLRESDFTTGEARYVTDVVDVPITEQTVTSTQEPMELVFPTENSGVYLVELTARDRLGRMQKVVADLFVKGDSAVAWKKPKNQVFKTVWDQESYNPGDTATLLLKSPFQQARALVCVEAPDSNRYSWVRVEGGKGLFKLVVEKAMTSRIPVHVLLLRGRLDGVIPTDGLDLKRPQTMAATAWLSVRPKEFQAKIDLEHPARCLPGARVPLTLTMTDPDGKPLNGEVALWLVDRAVLALGKEAELDPVPSFVGNHRAWNRLRDIRNQVVGALPLEEFPGGDGGPGDISLFGKVTVRRNFKTVAYYNPALIVQNGRAQVTIDMPENLTDYAVRVVGVSNNDRWGSQKSMISVRLPVIAQSALPRFVRPGDSFEAGAIGRIVEGDGGPGKVEIQVEGLALNSEAKRTLTWQPDKPEQLYFPLQVTTPAALPGEEPNTVTVRMAVSRDRDGASDGFEIKLPVKQDRMPVSTSTFAQLEANGALTFDGPAETPRPGSMSRTLLASGEPGILKILSALDYLSGFPHGCTEQRISRVMPELVMKETLDRIGRGARGAAADLAVRETLTHLGRVQDSQGLFGFWPGSRTYVSLTAYAVEFMVALKRAGYRVPDEMYNKAIRALQASLRSDYSGFIDGYAYRERAEALAALAEAGAFDQAYAFELAARAGNRPLYTEARVLHTMLSSNITSGSAIEGMGKNLWSSLVFALRDGDEVYRGLQYRARSWGGLILSSEIRTMAAVVRALHLLDSNNPRLRPLVDELVSLGQGDGWGSTAANAAAMRALNQVLNVQGGAGPKLTVAGDGGESTLDLAGQPLARLNTDSQGALSVRYTEGSTDTMPLVWQRLNYLPQAPGHQVTAENKGFVIDEELLFYDGDGPPVKRPLAAGAEIEAKMGAVIEVHVRVVTPEDRFFAAIRVPFAAGLEPMNPNLATAPEEATPAGQLTREADYTLFEDDRVTFYYDQLNKGTYNFYFRLRASIAGSFTHPAPRAELMYRQSVYGRGNGAVLKVLP
ncbi:MAG: alpha-2-macroglobulin family protein [Acidobacteriota bacterium]|nr:alpha-2-macroglobulin family protein [Acidobacteriota bacterium]